jgi:hypothetical protein
MSNNPVSRYLAIGAAAVVLTFGAYLIGRSNTGSASVGTNASAAAGAGAPRTGQAPPGFGTAVSSDTAKKVAAAATAKYPGTVERVMQLQDGSYVAHVITTSGERHVLVSKAFKVTGSQQGGPGGGGAPGAGVAPNSTPQPSAPSTSSGSSS